MGGAAVNAVPFLGPTVADIQKKAPSSTVESSTLGIASGAATALAQSLYFLSLLFIIVSKTRSNCKTKKKLLLIEETLFVYFFTIRTWEVIDRPLNTKKLVNYTDLVVFHSKLKQLICKLQNRFVKERNRYKSIRFKAYLLIRITSIY